jgi:hypothetical protein
LIGAGLLGGLLLLPGATSAIGWWNLLRGWAAIGIVYTVAAFYEAFLSGGRLPTEAEAASIDRAIGVIRATPGFAPYADRASRYAIYIYDPNQPNWLTGVQPQAFGSDPQFAPGLIFISDRMVQADPVMLASTIVHEIHHTYQAPLYSSSFRGEQAAYDADSRFLWAAGGHGRVWDLIRRFRATPQEYIRDQADSFVEFQIENPAIIR